MAWDPATAQNMVLSNNNTTALHSQNHSPRECVSTRGLRKGIDTVHNHIWIDSLRSALGIHFFEITFDSGEIPDAAVGVSTATAPTIWQQSNKVPNPKCDADTNPTA